MFLGFAEKRAAGVSPAPHRLTAIQTKPERGSVAIGRLSMKVGKAGKAGPHAAYIAREGQYASRLERGERLEATEAGNMPAWARSSPQEFWQAADANERANGTTYREMEIALPRELTPEQRARLVRDFVQQEIGDRHAYQWAIHTPTAADGKEQPHVHLMFSERQTDGIERDPEQYFKRYNGKNPERSGARKGYGPHAGETLTREQRTADLKDLRTRWSDMANRHLERAGRDERIDMRSHAERGTGLEPERKQLPSRWRGAGRDNVIEFRAARRELVQAREQQNAIIPDARAEVVSIEQARQQREQKWDKMSAAEVRQEIDRYKQRSGPLPYRPAEDVALQDPRVANARRRLHDLVRQQQADTQRRDQAQREMEEWSQQNPMRARMASLGLSKNPYLAERQGIVQQASEALSKAPQAIERAQQEYHDLHRDVTGEVSEKYRPQREWVERAEKLAAERDRTERMDKAREAQREAEERREQDREQDRVRKPPERYR